METLLVIKENSNLAFRLGERKLKVFDTEDFIHDGLPFFPYSDNYISIEVMRDNIMIDFLRTTTEKGKYPGDLGEMMFAGLMTNSNIIREWRKKNPGFLGINQLTTGISADMFEEGDILKIEHSFQLSLTDTFTRAKLFIN